MYNPLRGLVINLTYFAVWDSLVFQRPATSQRQTLESIRMARTKPVTYGFNVRI
jgi:hypothetical protein